MKTIAYAFNSAVCCPSCTRQAFESGELTRDLRKPEILDRHRVPVDSENTVGEPIVSMTNQDLPQGFTCDECGEVD